MEEKLKEVFAANKVVKQRNTFGGDISQTSVYLVDDTPIFVKINENKNARQMFEGEFEGLKQILATGTVKCPQPYHIFQVGTSTCFAMEYLKLSYLDTKQSELGRQLGNLHLHNSNSDQPITSFGFPVPTCCGRISLDNSWNDDWKHFYANQRVAPQVKMAGNSQAAELWEEFEKSGKMDKMFPPNLRVRPSLLHGDLWSGNCGECHGNGCLFDPASFYGHHEFDLAIARMFGGFTAEFFGSYHRVVPRSEGFEERAVLYDLFHHLNHWNHFGDGYKSGCLRLLRKLNSFYE